MGASGWSYFVPYRAEINAALQELREQVFRKGEYYRVAPYWKERKEEDYAGYPEERRRLLVERLREKQSLAEPTTIESLLKWNGEEGTHSILDVDRVTAEPEPGSVSPLKDQELLDIFGTLAPTRELIEQKSAEIQLLRRRGTGTWIAVYRGDTPVEIFFGGYSGD
jgi:hypothetical protein